LWHCSSHIEWTLGTLVLAIDSLAGNAVRLRGIPSDEGLIDMIVAEVAVLVVGGIKIGEIKVSKLMRQFHSISPDAISMARNQVRDPKLKILIGSL